MDMATKAKKKSGKRLGVRFVFDAQGKKTEVLLPIALYERMLEELEDAEDIRAADEAMKDPESIPLEEVKKQLGL